MNAHCLLSLARDVIDHAATGHGDDAVLSAELAALERHELERVVWFVRGAGYERQRLGLPAIDHAALPAPAPELRIGRATLAWLLIGAALWGGLLVYAVQTYGTVGP